MANYLQQSDSINLVKPVICINNQKTLFSLGGVNVPNRLNPMYFSVDSCLKYFANMVILACMGGLGYREFQHALSENLAPYLPDAHQKYSGQLIQCSQAAGHKIRIVGQWWDLIGHIFKCYVNRKIIISSKIPHKYFNRFFF